MSSQAGIQPAELTLMASVPGRAALPAGRPPARAGLRTTVHVTVALWALTALAAALGAIAPGLAPGSRPHPTLHGTVGELLGILATNLRVLAAPFLLIMFRWPAGRCTRRLGDLLIVALILVNTVQVGLAIGAFGHQLIPYLPHLPLEWAALGCSTGAWLQARHRCRTRVLVARGAAVLVLATGAALCEVTLTPHAQADRQTVAVSRAVVDVVRDPLLAGPRVSFAFANHAPTRPGRFKVAALPSPRFARFRSAVADANRTTSTTRSPQGGTT